MFIAFFPKEPLEVELLGHPKALGSKFCFIYIIFAVVPMLALIAISWTFLYLRQ